MKNHLGVLVIVALVLSACDADKDPMGEMTIRSPAFSEGHDLPLRHTCYGEDVSPPLLFHGAPNQTASLCVLLEDLDDPAGEVARWVVWNIPAGTLAVDENGMGRVPGAVVGVNDAGLNEYDGPCRPADAKGAEQRRYRFTVMALDSSVELAPSSGREELLKAIDGHVLASGTLTGYYRWY